MKKQNKFNLILKKTFYISFFLSLGLGFPSEEASEIFSIFKQLYQSEYLSKNIQDDELFAYMALTYSVNEIVKAISFILHKMLIKKN